MKVVYEVFIEDDNYDTPPTRIELIFSELTTLEEKILKENNLKYEYTDENKVKITFGKLVANDATLPENLSDAWIAPQNYAVFTMTSNALETWRHIQQQPELNRRFHADFETYPHYGAAKIYVGLVGDVQIIEE